MRILSLARLHPFNRSSLAFMHDGPVPDISEPRECIRFKLGVPVISKLQSISVSFVNYCCPITTKLVKNLESRTNEGELRSIRLDSLSTVDITQSNLHECHQVVTKLRSNTSHYMSLGHRSFKVKPGQYLGKDIFISQTRSFFIVPTSRLRMSPERITKEPNEHDVPKPREIEFNNSYGHLACLEWGDRNAPNKILCIHGWLDNAGSFERLIPHILSHKDNHKKYHIIAMDMPGVGHSSHRPPGSEYTIFSNVIEMRRVTQQLCWHQNLTLLAHSLGGHLSFIYSCIYPRQVSTLISIDTTHPITHQVANWNVSIGNAIEHYFKCESYGQKNERLDAVVPVYSEADAIKRLMDAHGSSLTYESARVMFKRGATRHENGTCTFNRDIRHRHPSVEFRPTDDMMLKLMDGTFMPNNLMIIRATRSPYHRPEMRAKYYELYERNCKLFRDILIDGTHHVHMNSPEEVGAEICKFLDMVQGSNDCDISSSKRSSSTLHIDKPNL